jgi:hypothetical protein
MRGRIIWLAGLLAAGLTLAPAPARAQDGERVPDSGPIPDVFTIRAKTLDGEVPDYNVAAGLAPAPALAQVPYGRPDPNERPVPDGRPISEVFSVRGQTPDGELPDYEVPVPLGHNPANKGGFYLASTFVYFRETNPLQHQPLAYRGFIDADGSVPASNGVPGTRYGSGALALDAKDAGGPGTYQPGLKVNLGYWFKDGTSIDVEWMNLEKAQYFHEATIAVPGFNFGTNLADSFLWSPVYGFTNAYAGPQNKINGGDATATYGIWDGADISTISFIQRTESLQAKLKTPLFYNDDFGYRMYGMVGPRFFWIWERFLWRTVNQNPDGTADATDVANYTNIVSNRMYGVFCGVGNEWYIGHGFACNLDLDMAGMIDVVKERAQYQLGDKFLPGTIKRAKTDYSLVPEARAEFNLTWFPIENVEIKVGYDFMVFANTIAAPDPVSFNVGGLDPAWERRWRVFDGFTAGLGIIF